MSGLLIYVRFVSVTLESQESISHKVFKTPWQGDPRVNIQNDNGKAKAYQVGQVLKAIEKMEDGNNA